tara:strand:+ start:161 stop:427 length:267 start_codon:yes stop_codon:yes gene_type:complete
MARKKAGYMSGLIIKDILMSEMNENTKNTTTSKVKKFTHDEVVQVAGEYLVCKETGKWVSATDVEDYENEWINIEIQQFYEKEQDKYY